MLLERGPRPVIIHALPDVRERKAHEEQLLTMVGRLWASGVAIDWHALHAGQQRRRIPLPGYQFERRKYWIEPRQRTVEPASHSGPRRAKLRELA